MSHTDYLRVAGSTAREHKLGEFTPLFGYAREDKNRGPHDNLLAAQSLQRRTDISGNIQRTFREHLGNI
jgi:hypothetical protein